MRFPSDVTERCERSIVLSADHVAKLRKCDVWRVMGDYFHQHGSTAELVDYISVKRPDLADAAKAEALELVAVEGGAS